MNTRDYDNCPAFPHIDDYRQLLVLFKFTDPNDNTILTFEQMHQMITGTEPSEHPEIRKLQMWYVRDNWNMLKYIVRSDGHNWPVGSVQWDGKWLHGHLDADQKKKVIDRNNSIKKGVAIGINRVNKLLGSDAPPPIPIDKWEENQKRIGA
jgi:hypothetical protein